MSKISFYMTTLLLLFMGQVVYAEVCLQRMSAVSKVYGPNGVRLIANQNLEITEAPHIPSFLSVDPGSTLNYQRQLPYKRCGGCAILFGASLNGFDHHNATIINIESRRITSCLLTRNVSLTIFDGVQSHTFEVWDYDPLSDTLMVADYAPNASMLIEGRNFSDINGRLISLPNGLKAISLKFRKIFPHLTSIHFLLDESQLPKLVKVLGINVPQKELNEQLVYISALSGNKGALSYALHRLPTKGIDNHVGKLGSLILYLLDFQDGSASKDTIDLVHTFFKTARYNPKDQKYFFDLKDIGYDFISPFFNSEFPDMLLSLFAHDLSNKAGIVLINEWYPDLSNAPLEVQFTLAKLNYQMSNDQEASRYLDSVISQTNQKIHGIIDLANNDQELNIFHAYMTLDQPINLELSSVRDVRREALLMKFSIQFAEAGLTSPEVVSLARMLIIEYPEHAAHWLNYATIVAALGDGSCAHALIKTGEHYATDGEQRLVQYSDEFKQNDEEPQNLLPQVKSIVNDHPIISRRSVCRDNKFFPRCFEQSQTVRLHSPKASQNSCFRFGKPD